MPRTAENQQDVKLIWTRLAAAASIELIYMFVIMQITNIYVVSKRSVAIDSMPAVVLSHLRELGENLSIARKRRRETRKAWAQRIGVSEPTLMRMEQGDPSVSMGVYATALWLMGREQAIAQLAAPEHDMGALEQAVRVAKARAVRKRPSLYGQSPAADGTAPDHEDNS